MTCRRFGCPPPEVTVGEVTTMLAWALAEQVYDEQIALANEEGAADLPQPPPPTPYWELDPAVARGQLVTMGRADNCPLTDLPLDALVSRAGMLEMIARAFGYLPPVACLGAL